MNIHQRSWENHATEAAGREAYRLPALRNLQKRPVNRTHLIVANPLDDDMIALLGIMSRQQWNVYWCTTCAEALEMLDSVMVPVVVCESKLPDGNWQSLLEQVNRRAEPPRFIVASRLADESLWGEALNLCAYDVLAKPFDRVEVVRVISAAVSSWLCVREERRLHAESGEQRW